MESPKSVADMSEQPDRFTTEGTQGDVLDAIEARLRAQWEAEHPDGFEGKGWDEWQREYEASGGTDNTGLIEP